MEAWRGKRLGEEKDRRADSNSSGSSQVPTQTKWREFGIRRFWVISLPMCRPMSTRPSAKPLTLLTGLPAPFPSPAVCKVGWRNGRGAITPDAQFGDNIHVPTQLEKRRLCRHESCLGGWCARRLRGATAIVNFGVAHYQWKKV